MADQKELERLSELLPRLAMAVIFQSMRSPDGIAVDKPHLRHTWLIARSVERIADAHGYWSQESTQALLDMQQAMLEALRLVHGQERGVPPEPDHGDRTGGEWQLQRDPDESDDDFERRWQLLENGGRVILDVADLSEAELEKIADASIPEDLRWHSDNALPPDLSELKRQIVRAIIYATEAAGQCDQPAFLRNIGMPEHWIVRAIEDVDRTELREFVGVYDAAAKAAGWKTLHEIVKEVTQRQRFREWP